MKLSGIVYLCLDFTFRGWRELAAVPLEVLPGDVAEDLHDGSYQGLWENLLIPFLDTQHFTWSNGLISREPGGKTSVP